MEPGSGTGGHDGERGPREYEGFDLSSPLRRFVSTARGVLFEPVGFFRDLAPRGHVRDPLVFALLCVLMPLPLAILTAPFDPFSEDAPNFPPSFFVRVFTESGVTATTFLAAVALIFFLLNLVIALFIVAAACHLLVRFFVKPTDTNYYATFRVFAYTLAVALVSWIPVAGPLATLYWFYLLFVGVRELHATTNGRAAAVALSAFILWLLLYLPDLLSFAEA